MIDVANTPWDHTRHALDIGTVSTVNPLGQPAYLRLQLLEPAAEVQVYLRVFSGQPALATSVAAVVMAAKSSSDGAFRVLTVAAQKPVDRIDNAMLIILNLPLIGMWIKLLTVPYRMLYPAILLFCAIGVYTVNNTSFDVMQTAFFGFLGVLFAKLECEPAPLLLGFVLGPMMEENLRRALLLSRGDAFVFFQRPISAGLLIAAMLLVVVIGLPNIRKKREEAFQEAPT